MEVLHPVMLIGMFACLLLLLVPTKEITIAMSPRQRLLTMWPVLSAVVGAFFIIGLARPQVVEVNYYDAVRPATIIGMLDNSGSMITKIATRQDVVRSNGYIVDRADEVEISKVIRESFASFAKNRNADNVGLTMFGDQAYAIVAPKLNNGAAIDGALKSYHEPNEGTDFPKSLNAVLDQFEKSPADYDRILVIATDGQLDIKYEEAEALKKRIKDLEVTVYMVVAGENVDNPTIQSYLKQGFDLIRDVASDDNILIATDGAAVAKAFRTIDRFEAPIWEVRENRVTTDVTWLPLSVAGVFALLLLGIFCFGNGKPKSEGTGENN